MLLEPWLLTLLMGLQLQTVRGLCVLMALQLALAPISWKQWYRIEFCRVDGIIIAISHWCCRKWNQLLLRLCRLKCFYWIRKLHDWLLWRFSRPSESLWGNWNLVTVLAGVLINEVVTLPSLVRDEYGLSLLVVTYVRVLLRSHLYAHFGLELPQRMVTAVLVV